MTASTIASLMPAAGWLAAFVFVSIAAPTPDARRWARFTLAGSAIGGILGGLVSVILAVVA